MYCCVCNGATNKFQAVLQTHGNIIIYIIPNHTSTKKTQKLHIWSKHQSILCIFFVYMWHHLMIHSFHLFLNHLFFFFDHVSLACYRHCHYYYYYYCHYWFRCRYCYVTIIIIDIPVVKDEKMFINHICHQLVVSYFIVVCLIFAITFLAFNLRHVYLILSICLITVLYIF